MAVTMAEAVVVRERAEWDETVRVAAVRQATVTEAVVGFGTRPHPRAVTVPVPCRQFSPFWVSAWA